MKKMFMALAVMAVASLASAVTVKWQATFGEKADTDSGVQAWCGVIFVAGHIDSTFNYTDAIMAADANGNRSDTGPNVKWSGTNTLLGIMGTDANNTNYSAVSTENSSEGYKQYSFASGEFTGTFNLEGKDFAVIIFNEYHKAYTAVNYSLGDSYTANTEDVLDLGSVLFTAASSSGGAGETVVDATVRIVPEPTVMALLALGVAGVALRRKLA